MTQSNKSGKLKPFLVLFFLFSFSLVYGIDNCNEKQPSDNIPCYILLPSSTACNLISVDFYNESAYLSSQNMGQYSPAICYANFTYSGIGTYNFNYTTGDSGAIVVEEGNKMINLLWFSLVVIALLTAFAFVLQNQVLFLLDGIAMLSFSVWLFSNGFSIYNNLVTMIVASVFFALGAYFTVMSGLAMIDGD